MYVELDLSVGVNAERAVSVADSPEVLALFHSELVLVEIIAASVYRLFGGRVEYDELMASGREGLLHAARRFDPTRGVPFRAYAGYRIRGAMRDSRRRLSKFPRGDQEGIAAFEAATLFNECGAEDVFAAGGMGDPRAARRAIEEHLSSLMLAAALGLVTNGHGEGSGDVGSPEEALMRAELLQVVRGALTDLQPEEEHVVRRHCLEGERLEDIARDLDVSTSWVSRLHTRAIRRLAKRLNGFTQ